MKSKNDFGEFCRNYMREKLHFLYFENQIKQNLEENFSENFSFEKLFPNLNEKFSSCLQSKKFTFVIYLYCFFVFYS